MSISYSIKVRMMTFFKQQPLVNILERGSQYGLIYYDHIMGEQYENGPFIDAQKAAIKIMAAIESKDEGGPCVFTKIDDTYCFIFFYRTDHGTLDFYIGSFGSPVRKDFRDGFYHIDLAYYVRLALDLTQDYALEEIGIESI